MGKKGVFEATLLFGNGSDRSYVSIDFVKKVKPRWISSEYILFSAFGGDKATKDNHCNVYNVKLFGCGGESYSFIATEIPNIWALPFCPYVPNVNLKAFSSLLMIIEIVVM